MSRGPSRRRVLETAAAGTALAAAPALADDGWKAGPLVHLLPTVSHERMLIKASFREPLAAAPVLSVGDRQVEGRRSDAEGRFWRFEADGLSPATTWRLRIADSRGRPLCDPWPLRTQPAPDASPASFRLLAYTCAGGFLGPMAPGGPEVFRPLAVRQALLDRALSFRPDAAIANGDHIYWDQRTWLESANPTFAATVRTLFSRYGFLDPSQPVWGGENEAVLKRVAGPQIAELYGVRMRSTPMFFVADDHDYFENDEATERYVTFPVEDFEVELKRAVQQLYYPEFLPDPTRPATLPGASAPDRWAGLSESFGTLRWGDLVEALIYDCGRHLSLKGKHAGLVPPPAEAWLVERTRAEDTRHLLHAPSHPFGWSAGKWREWYPDVAVSGAGPGVSGGVREMNLGSATSAAAATGGAHLSTAEPKFMWQQGWWNQHQRLAAALTAQPRRAAMMVSGDLHVVGWGRMTRSGDLDLSANPLNTILAGPVGTSGGGWPSAVRGMAPRPATDLALQEMARPVEKNGFTLMDFDRDRVIVRQFAWREPDPVEAIADLQPAATFEIARR